MSHREVGFSLFTLGGLRLLEVGMFTQVLFNELLS
jgi:hypothetical protein